MTALTLTNMCDAAVMVRQINRRAAARRLAELVQSGVLFADDYRLFTVTDPDVVVDAALALALRARSLFAGTRGQERIDNRVRGIIELDGDRELWAAKAGSVASDGHCFGNAADAIEWLERAVHNYLLGSQHEGDYYLQIGIVEGQIRCNSALPHNEAGWCEVCWAVEQAWRSAMTPRSSVTELNVTGEHFGTRGVPRRVGDNADCVGEAWGSWYGSR